MKLLFLALIVTALVGTTGCGSSGNPQQDSSTGKDLSASDAPAETGSQDVTPGWDSSEVLLEDLREPDLLPDTLPLTDTEQDSSEVLQGEDLIDTVDTLSDTWTDTWPEVAEDVAEDIEEEVFEYVYQPEGTCGAEAYSWLKPNEVGDIVDWNENLLYNLPPELIDMLLEEAGYPGLVKAQYGVRVFYIRYTTQDRGQLLQASALVGVPDLDFEQGGVDPATFETILFLHPTMGYANKCAPSDSLEGGAAAVVPASLGYIAVAPDYIGLCGEDNPCGGDMFHPYLVGEPTAIASLDAVRAGHDLVDQLYDQLGIQPTGRVVPWGVSQGGHATLFVDRYAPVYAPEYEVPCAVAIVPPADLASQANLALDHLGEAASLGTAFLAAASMWYFPGEPANSLFNAEGPQNYPVYIPETFVQTCNANNFMQGATQITDLYNPTFIDQLHESGLDSITPWGCVAAENSLPTTSVPYYGDSRILFVIGENDSLVAHAVEEQTFQTLCDGGYKLEFLECSGGSHWNTSVDTLAAQVNWVATCLADQGIPEEELCQLHEPVDCKNL